LSRDSVSDGKVRFALCFVDCQASSRFPLIRPLVSSSLPMPTLDPHRFSWTKRAAASTAEDWFATLAHLGPMRVMITQNAGAKQARIQAHGLTEFEAQTLLETHGGSVGEATWLTAEHPPQRAPINVRGRFYVVSTEGELAAIRANGGSALWIPAALAFGTGEHATTAMCLRHLADISKRRNGTPWSFLDLGTGSAILAMAAKIFGAQDILGTDFDALALKTARENLQNNSLRGIKLERSDVLKWTPGRTWTVVAANLFSGVLIEAAHTISSAVAPAGELLLSGVLREQEQEVLAAFERRQMKVQKVGRKGKWISARLNRDGF
jgi:ribosomal protein L11 methyltransferase